MSSRRRRTAEESRELILAVAARRLREHGLEGLNITGVAEEAGISHATLIHHFGSSSGMRTALTNKMTLDLVSDLSDALTARAPVDQLMRNVFTALAEGGHAQLVAWRAVEGKESNSDYAEISDGIKQLMITSQKMLGMNEEKEIQNIIMLIAVAALGFGLAGAVIGNALDMSEDDLKAFPEWMKSHII